MTVTAVTKRVTACSKTGMYAIDSYASLDDVALGIKRYHLYYGGWPPCLYTVYTWALLEKR